MGDADDGRLVVVRGSRCRSRRGKPDRSSPLFDYPIRAEFVG